MNTKDMIAELRRRKAEMVSNREADGLKIALDQIALVKLRIQQTGINSDGQKFAPYVPAYVKTRKKGGYQVEFVDLTRTGRLFAGIVPTVSKSTPFSVEIDIAPADQHGKDILAGLSKKRPNILKPNRAEQAMIQEANRQRVFKYLKFS